MEDDDDGDWADQLGSLYISRPKSTTTASASGSNYTTTSMPSPAPPPEFRKKVVPYSTVDLLLGGDDAHPPPQPPPLQRRKGESFHFGDPGDPDLEWSTQQQSQRSYHHSSSLPDDAFRARQHLPPPHHHHLQLGGASAPLFSLERIPSPSSADDEGEGHAATPGTLPEFLGSGGGQGIFKLPPRAAVHPCRPPSLEVRPHPLRETQAGTFLRTIACSPTQLWAGQENGVRFWSFDEFFSAREEGSGRVRKGDEESAPFHESSHTSPTMCLAVDAANRLVWSGHKDGKIRSWRIDHQQSVQSSASSDWGSFDSQFSSNNSNVGVARFKEGLSWQAHRAPVLSMAFTSYGDLWSGSEGGTIKIWPWETIEKALSCSAEERHIAALLAERSYVDLRSQVTVGGACPLPSVDVKFLLSDNSRLKVWSGGSLSFALWNSRTKELLKVFGIDGQIETRLDISLVQEAYGEDDTKVKFVSMSKKEKAQGPMSFFQRSRNALIGAADAVRRVATKGAFGDDTRKTEALAISINGTVWTGCANGALVQWDEHGNRLQEFQYQSCSVQCLCTYGTRLWVGYVNGSVQVLDLDGKLLGGWNAHSSPVIKMAVGGGYIFTLANHGGVRGWNLTSPGPIDDILRSELTNKEDLFTKRENIKILTGTWNVGQERASHDSLISWVGCSASEADIVVVGLQEVEMGAGVLAMAAAKETVGLEGSTNGQWWLDAIGKTLDEGTTFERVGSRQLAGLLISIWARKRLRKYIGDIDAGAVPCGFGRAIGNKGSVGLRMRVYDRILCFMNCHFAAHLEAVNRRNADFDHVYRSMSFSRPAGSSPAVQLLRVSNISSINYDDGKPELSEADLIVFLGDFNYRLHGISYDDARDSISQRSFDWLREKDQLRAEMRAGKVFQGMREGLIRFPPTYKFERHQIGLSGYDSGEKKRIPAWCDRILYRDSHSMLKDDHSMSEKESCSLKYPIVSSILEYDACMEVTDSDHKPVRCILNVDIARVDELVRRQEYGQILSSNERVRSLLKETSVPEIILSTNNIILQDQATSIVRITNRCENDNALFEISCEGESSIKDDGFASEHHPRGAFGFPRWLEVKPAAGIIKRGQIIEVSLHHEEFHTFEEYVDGAPQNSWCEDTRDKEVILVVNVTGSFTPVSKSHQIRVRHCYTKTEKSESRSNSRRIQSNLLHRSDIRNLSSTTDVDDLWCLHSP